MSIFGKAYKVSEAAKALNVTEDTVQRWIKKGKLKAIRLPSGQYRVSEVELTAVLYGER
jgi:excisionase family DNA binding protein